MKQRDTNVTSINDGMLKSWRKSWDTEEDYGYDEAKFYTRSVDEKGHKDIIHTPVPPFMYSMAAELIARRNIREYRSVQDFVRDAMHHRMHYLNEKYIHSPAIDKQLMLERQLVMAEQKQLEMQTIRRVLDTNEATIKEAANIGSDRLLDEALDSAREATQYLEEPFKSQLQQTIDRYAK